ncbi:hypothetical protein CHU95_14625 [Niveispirillum lacus]|uniref:Molybdenum cofactor guanylyltransferase n=1 Tax=Niveispirillum lacus TaxID=1981099 RepID=A0A255YWQ5_9PROT|nr:molybdenum cofactor guanylyltransferase MobA [Niveispirillum lacus]OYQ33609.1 hypothetical protein CHU95_14625 [Niveispirillum lacus]
MQNSGSPAPPCPICPVLVVLAGGQAQRMGGGDKGLRLLAGTPILHHVLARARHWTDLVLLSALGDPGRFHNVDGLAFIPVLADGVPDQPGPLAGILAAMEWTAEQAPERTHVLSVPCDTPFLPAELGPMLSAKAGNGIAMAQGPDGQRQPTVALWPVALRHDLRHALVTVGLRRVGEFAARHELTLVPFPAGSGGVDPFFNINDPADLDRAEQLIRTARP